MKLLCDICGGQLQMCDNGKGATCTGCGINYSVENLRAKLNSQTATEAAAKPISDTPAFAAQTDIPVTKVETTKIQRHSLLIERKTGIQDMAFSRFNVLVQVDGQNVALLAYKSKSVSVPICQGDHEIRAMLMLGNKVTQVLEPVRIQIGAYDWCCVLHARRTAWSACMQMDLNENRL